jgi:hypothetical protein
MFTSRHWPAAAIEGLRPLSAIHTCIQVQGSRRAAKGVLVGGGGAPSRTSWISEALAQRQAPTADSGSRTAADSPGRTQAVRDFNRQSELAAGSPR